MSSFLSIRGIAVTFACASIAIGGIVGPALAQSRSLWLSNNGETTITGYFLQGEDIYANCDEDCMNLDLFLYTDAGVLVDSDSNEDAFPIVTVPYDGTFSVQVAMPSCVHSAGCSVAVNSEHGF